jgi:2Fe-2S ferredoxin
MADHPSSSSSSSRRVFKIEFRAAGEKQGRVLTIDREKLPESGHGLPGSLLDLALASDIEIDHACGGVSACSTCHVILRQGFQSCAPAEENEEDQLDEAPGLTSLSRLACQCVPTGAEDLVVEIPSWNRNRMREGS